MSFRQTITAAMLSAMPLISACNAETDETLTDKECLAEIDSTQAQTKLAIGEIWTHDGKISWKLSPIYTGTQINMDDLRCFITDEEGAVEEANHVSGILKYNTHVYNAPQGEGSMWISCSTDCKTWELIANCEGGFGCDVQGHEGGKPDYQIQ